MLNRPAGGDFQGNSGGAGQHGPNHPGLTNMFNQQALLANSQQQAAAFGSLPLGLGIPTTRQSTGMVMPPSAGRPMMFMMPEQQVPPSPIGLTYRPPIIAQVPIRDAPRPILQQQQQQSLSGAGMEHNQQHQQQTQPMMWLTGHGVPRPMNMYPNMFMPYPGATQMMPYVAMQNQSMTFGASQHHLRNVTPTLIPKPGSEQMEAKPKTETPRKVPVAASSSKAAKISTKAAKKSKAKRSKRKRLSSEEEDDESESSSSMEYHKKQGAEESDESDGSEKAKPTKGANRRIYDQQSKIVRTRPVLIEESSNDISSGDYNGEQRLVIDFENFGEFTDPPERLGKKGFIPDNLAGSFMMYSERWFFRVQFVGPAEKASSQSTPYRCIKWGIRNEAWSEFHELTEAREDALRRNHRGVSLCNKVFTDAMEIRAKEIDVLLKEELAKPKSDSTHVAFLEGRISVFRPKRFSEGPLLFGLRHKSVQSRNSA